MKLVLAEKPSVAQSIAKVLGANERFDGYLEGNGYVVSWCVGHLVELFEPEGYDERYSKWSYDDLPIVPDEWKYQVSAGTRKQFGVLRQLMKRDDVESLVCATDAGREGELIFRLVYHQCRCKKPFERLWISSMEDFAIREGFSNLKPSKEYDALYEAALSRERADWIVGINATRLFSVLYGQTLNVGRVMTPTLGMAVMREAAISAFRSEPFYSVQLGFPEFVAVGERLKEKKLAEEMVKKCRDSSAAVVTKIEKKDKTEKAPALYDLTSLQRDANRVLGFTAQQTLDYTQNLYEKKLVTYPRTDSRYLTEDMAGGLPELVSRVAQAFEKKGAFDVNAAQVINNKKVSDHHAIIPTQSMANADLQELPAGERAVLQLIAVRLAILGLVQWIKRKNIWKVDSSILSLGVFYILVFGVYAFFEFYVINCRPILINGILEASYPSSTTMLAMCVLPTAMMQFHRLIKNIKIRNIVNVSCGLFTAFMVIGRLICGVHWFTDIFGGLLFSIAMILLYCSTNNLILAKEKR